LYLKRSARCGWLWAAVETASLYLGAKRARFLTRKQVAEELNISMAQAYALLRRRELRAAKIGGRGDYRIGRDHLEAYIERTYAETQRWIEEHPYSEEDPGDA
jgi:excisionase family DNA binding protein